MSGKQPGEGRTITFDDPIFLIGMIVAIYLICWAIWVFGHTYLSQGYAYIRYVEFYLLHLLGEIGPLPGASTVHEWLSRLCAPDGMIGACQRDFSTVQWVEISDSSIYVNIFLAICLTAYCVVLFKRVNATHPKLRFSKAHTLKSFIDEQKSAVNPKDGKLLYPHLRLFSALDMIGAPLDDPLFGMSETSRQFIQNHALVAGWRAEPDGFWAPTLDREKATEIFRVQLGKHWTSSANLSPGETLLVAIAMPRVAATNPSLDDKQFKAAMDESEAMIRYCWDQFVPPEKAGKKSGADDVVNALPFAWLKPEIDLALARDVIKKYIGHEAVRAILNKHAFNRTVIFALYTQARRLGVLQPADMRWMRFFDRPLWYALNTIGRQAGFAEAAGVLSHYLYECKSGTSLVEPQLDKAVSGLDMALNNFKFTVADKTRYENAHPAPNVASKGK
jgi:intracellular multiplication protein IcmP